MEGLAEPAVCAQGPEVDAFDRVRLSAYFKPIKCCRPSGAALWFYRLGFIGLGFMGSPLLEFFSLEASLGAWRPSRFHDSGMPLSAATWETDP
jgi:hypothetical protein